MKKIIHDGNELTIQFNQYENNDRIAIRLYMSDGEPYCDATVNIPDVDLKPLETAIPEYKCPGLLKTLYEAEVISEPIRSIRYNMISNLPICNIICDVPSFPERPVKKETKKDELLEGEVLFSLHGPSYERSDEKILYKVVIGKSGKRWIIPVNGNSKASDIHVEAEKIEQDPNYREFQGYGGATLTWPLENGESVSLKGPWHSNSDSLFSDTGIDLRKESMTIGIVALNRRSLKLNDYAFSDVLHQDLQWTPGDHTRIGQIAQEYANKLNKKVYCAYKSLGGACASWKDPITDKTQKA